MVFTLASLRKVSYLCTIKPDYSFLNMSIMKKIYALLPMIFAVLMSAAFTSCEDDEIADTLEGTWQGNMRIKSNYRGHTYYATKTEVTFLRDVNYYSSGDGYWVDYYSNAPWDYVANHISWRVDCGDIMIHFIEEDTNFIISDYRLNNSRFEGTLWDHDQRVDFTLYHTSSPNWNRYDQWGYNHFYTRGSDGEKPTRSIGK